MIDHLVAIEIDRSKKALNQEVENTKIVTGKSKDLTAPQGGVIKNEKKKKTGHQLR